MNNKAGFVLKQTYIIFVNVVLLNLPVFPSFGKPYLLHLVSKHQHYNSKKKLTLWHEDFIKLWVMWRYLLLPFYAFYAYTLEILVVHCIGYSNTPHMLQQHYNMSRIKQVIRYSCLFHCFQVFQKVISSVSLCFSSLTYTDKYCVVRIH